ncbi:MAG TPA: hypothetical protein VFQ65_22925 [Kofleriaceae bacterium]|nr:hypothetical protein [Kofleriaceae bacterium]
MKWWVAVAVAVGCHKTPRVVRAVTAEESTQVATKFIDAALPCIKHDVDDLIDRDGLDARLEARLSGAEVSQIGVASTLSGSSLLANKICAWMSDAMSYNLVRVRFVDGRARAVLRRTTAENGVAYHELLIERSSDDAPRVVDVYSYHIGEWASDQIADTVQATQGGVEALENARLVKRIGELEDQRKFDEALATLDQLAPAVRDLRANRSWRLKIARKISPDAYASALDDLARRFPEDGSLDLQRMDAAFLHHDYTGALRAIDAFDAKIGTDPYWDGVRAQMLATRNGPGDLDAADKDAAHASEALPRLSVGTWGRITIALVRKQWPAALAQLDVLAKQFHQPQSDEMLRRNPYFKELVETPEYAAWRAQHP